MSQRYIGCLKDSSDKETKTTKNIEVGCYMVIVLRVRHDISMAMGGVW